MKKITKTVASLAFVLLLATSAGLAATGGAVNWGADSAPQINYERTETKAVHNMSWGTSSEDLRKYEDDSGDIVTMNARVNEDVANPVSFVATDIEFDDFGAFPHAKEDVSALTATEWSVSGQNSSAATVSNVETAPSLNAVRFDTDGTLSSGASATATFSNFSLTSNENKRYLSLAMDVNQIESGAALEVSVVDEDGDIKTAVVDPSRSSGEDLIANSTGEGYLFQTQLGAMNTTDSDSDGYDNIQSVQVSVVDGDADVSVSMLNLDKMSPYSFGTTAVDGDDDDSEPGDATESITEIKEPGAISLTGLDTLDSSFDTATIHGVDVQVVETGADQSADDVYLNVTETDKWPSYAGKVKIAVRYGEPDAYDLTPSNQRVNITQTVTNDRLLSVEHVEGVDKSAELDSEFVGAAEGSDLTGQFSGEGDTIQADSSVSPGESNLAVFEFKVDADQLSNHQSGGSGGTGGKSSGGIGSIPVIGGLIVAVLGVLRKFGGGN